MNSFAVFSFKFKKFITFFIEPIGLILLLALFGLYFLFKNKLTPAKVLLSLVFSLLFTFSYPPVANYLTTQLESQYSVYNTKMPIDYIHILGNWHYKNPFISTSSKLSDAATKRILEAIMIYQRMDKKPTLIFTGFGVPVSNAKMAANFANALGVKNSAMVINGKPKDTIEEALFAKSIIGKKSLLLVTSAAHMPRAIQLFKQVGLNPTPAPADFKSTKSNWLSPPNIDALQKSHNAIHEYLGLLWIQVKSF